MLILLSLATVTFLISVLVERDNQVTKLADMPIFYLPKLVILLLLIPIGVSVSDVQLYKMYFIWSIILVALTVVWMGVLYNMPKKALSDKNNDASSEGEDMKITPIPQSLAETTRAKKNNAYEALNIRTSKFNNWSSQKNPTSKTSSDAQNVTKFSNMLFRNMIYPFRTTRSKATTTSNTGTGTEYSKWQDSKGYLNNVNTQNSNNQGNQ